MVVLIQACIRGESGNTLRGTLVLMSLIGGLFDLGVNVSSPDG